MEKLLSTFAVTLASFTTLALPLNALAYLSPEQVFGGQAQDLRPAPMTQREGEQAIIDRQQRTEDWRTQQQESLTSIDDEPEDAFIPPATTERPNLLDENVQYDLRMQRMQEAAARGGGPTIVVAGDGTVVDGKGNVLHSGAPLVTSTGPTSLLAVGAMLLAGMCTIGYVSIRSRRFPLSLRFRSI